MAQTSNPILKPLDLKPGPYTDLVPPPRQRDRDALRVSIEQQGVLEPVVVDEDGVIIDGHHRHRFAVELGLEDVPYRVVTGLDDLAKSALAIELNLHRRQLSTPQVQSLITKLRDVGMSTRAIAEKTGVSQSTVARSIRTEQPLEPEMSKAEAREIVDAYQPKRGRPPAKVARARQVLNAPDPAGPAGESDNSPGRDGRPEAAVAANPSVADGFQDIPPTEELDLAGLGDAIEKAVTSSRRQAVKPTVKGRDGKTYPATATATKKPARRVSRPVEAARLAGSIHTLVEKTRGWAAHEFIAVLPPGWTATTEKNINELLQWTADIAEKFSATQSRKP